MITGKGRASGFQRGGFIRAALTVAKRFRPGFDKDEKLLYAFAVRPGRARAGGIHREKQACPDSAGHGNGGEHMRIAIPYYMGKVFQHFGHAPQFKVYEIENHQILMELVVEVEQKGHDAVAALLKSMDVRAVICGSIGDGAMRALNDAGIVFYGGVTGEADDAIEALAAGGLRYDPSIRCEEHGGTGCDSCGGDCGDCGGCAGC